MRKNNCGLHLGLGKFTAHCSKWLIPTTFVLLLAATPLLGQVVTDQSRAVIDRAVSALGGQRYLNVTSQVSRGKFSLMRDGGVVSFQSFLDIIVFPDKERTEFKTGGSRSVQVNVGDTGWIYDNDVEVIKDQTEVQLASFKRGIRTSIDHLLRGGWKGDAELSYVGRRAATLGKRNEVVKLKYSDGFEVEFEFAVDTGLPQKAVYTRIAQGGEMTVEEDRYAQYVDNAGIRSPFIIDRYTDGKQASRINFESIEYNRRIPDSVFKKPANVKEAKKDVRF